MENLRYTVLVRCLRSQWWQLAVLLKDFTFYSALFMCKTLEECKESQIHFNKQQGVSVTARGKYVCVINIAHAIEVLVIFW